MNLDVGDGAQVHAAFLVYLDLTEGEKRALHYRTVFLFLLHTITRTSRIACVVVRHWRDVVGVACPELQAVLLEGREKEDEPVQVVYPLPAHRTVSHKE